MVLTIKDDDGYVRTLNDVLAYDCICKEDVETVCEELKVKVSTKMLDYVRRACDHLEEFPNMEILRWIIRDFLKEEHEILED